MLLMRMKILSRYKILGITSAFGKFMLATPIPKAKGLGPLLALADHV